LRANDSLTDRPLNGGLEFARLSSRLSASKWARREDDTLVGRLSFLPGSCCHSLWRIPGFGKLSFVLIALTGQRVEKVGGLSSLASLVDLLIWMGLRSNDSSTDRPLNGGLEFARLSSRLSAPKWAWREDDTLVRAEGFERGA
jgi:hypothetical protein